MSADHYRILGVTPGAEDAVIRAAYRALMRMYHPDTNDDPKARSRVREITAAFAVLGDPDRRAAYDAGQIFGTGSISAERTWLADRRSPPPMRAAGLASIAVAIAVTLAFALPRFQPGPEPQALRNLAAYRGITGAEPAAEPVAAPAARATSRSDVEAVSAAPPQLPAPMASAAIEPSRASTPAAPTREIVKAEQRPQPPVVVAVRQKPNDAPKAVAAESCPQCSDRRAQVERLATGFLKQSLEHADFHKQQLLLSARNRSATSRTMCRSDDCVTEAYMRQIRDTTTIMQGGIPNP